MTKHETEDNQQGNDNKHWLRRLLKSTKTWIGSAFVFAGVFISLTSWIDRRVRDVVTSDNYVTGWIDSRIKAVVTDESYVRRIAAEVRPSVIFDSHGSFLVDQGAMRYLDDIVIAEVTVGATNFPAKIIVKPKQYLAHAPIITGLDMPEARAIAERGKKFDWDYSVQFGPLPEAGVAYRFRLEIIPN